MLSLEHEKLICPRDMTLVLESRVVSQKFTMELDLVEGDSVIEVVRRAMEENSVPINLEPVLLSNAHRVISSSSADIDDRQATAAVEDDAAVSAAVADFSRRLRLTHQHFHKLPAEPRFPSAFNAVLRSYGSTFDRLLQMEASMAQAVEEELTKRQRSLNTLHERHARERDAAAAAKEEKAAIQAMLARQANDVESVSNRWAAEIAEMKRAQRKAYHDYIVRVYRTLHPEVSPSDFEYSEMRKPRGSSRPNSRSGSRSTSRSTSRNSIGSHDLYDDRRVIISPMRKSISTDSSLSAVAAGLASPPATILLASPTLSAAGVEPGSPSLLDTKLVAELTEMGFESALVELALTLGENNKDQALSYLLEKADVLAEMLATASRKASPAALSPSNTTAMPQQRRRTSSVGSIPVSHSTPQIPSPTPAPHVSSPPSAPQLSSVTSPSASPSASGDVKAGSKALSAAQSFMSNAIGRLGRVRSQLPTSLSAALSSASSSLVQEEAPAAHIPLAESFSVQLGSQEKTSLNIRIAVEPLLEDDRGDPQRHMAQRAQTLMSVYTPALMAGVLVTKHDVLPTGAALSPIFKELCDATTEFHFDTLEEQLKEAFEALRSAGRGNWVPLVSVGDYFVTRHSNLPLLHVAFHLISDCKPGELTNRSPVMTGLRNIVKAVVRYDMAQLSLPLLLLPEETVIDDPFPVCLRRAEMVLKAVKGLLIEQRATKAASTVSSSGSRLIQFLLPRATTPEQFAAYRQVLTTVFRVN